MKNAGLESSVIINNLLENVKGTSYGYDASKDKYCDMIKSGIIDPMKVVRSAL